MALEYAEAVAALYRSPSDQFVSERKRLAAELKAGGDKAGAARLAKLARPSLSAWAVNQLWWQARPGFEELLASGERLRKGERSAQAAHRDALAALRTRASSLLSESGHAVTDATLRRVTTTLAALAAVGGFAPDEPGALSADRDPPGFEALGGMALGGAPARGAEAEAAAEAGAAGTATAATEAGAGAAPEPGAAAAAEEDRKRERAEAERREREQRERLEAERTRLIAQLEQAREHLASSAAAVTRLQAELGSAQQVVERSRGQIADLERRLAQLETGAIQR
jgi:hypothetical protein